MFIKATMSIWNRNHEDGSYEAEHEGWKLVVTYTPEPPLPQKGDYGFAWVVTSPEGKEQKSTELLEEPEMAMMQAEQVVGLRDKDGEPVPPKASGEGEEAALAGARRARGRPPSSRPAADLPAPGVVGGKARREGGRRAGTPVVNRRSSRHDPTVLRHDPDLLPERRASRGPRLLDHRGRRARQVPPHAGP
ncbi:MAG: hypothetical protein MUF64_27680 [Polyangiaceae bacterium]|nr:hypothetical protein [Polyangiaceae bacterium]